MARQAGIPSNPYAFRLWAGDRWGIADEGELKSTFDGWIEYNEARRNPDGSPTLANKGEAIRLVLLDLIRYRLGKSEAEPQTHNAPLQDAVDFTDLRESIIAEVMGNVNDLLRQIAKSPAALGDLADIGARYEEGDDIPEDEFADMLLDFHGRQDGELDDK